MASSTMHQCWAGGDILMPALSVVAPCYNEAEGLPAFHRRMSEVCAAVAGSDYEIILVDDGSRDGTWQRISELAAADPQVLGVSLLRNHGHQLAATAGLTIAKGQRVLLIDADLQDPPELLGAMMAAMDEGADVVYGQRSSRAGETWFKLASASLFYRLLSYLSTVPIPRDTGDFRLMSRRVVDALLLMPERQRFIRGMVSWIGGRQTPLRYERQPRHAGRTGYPLRKMVHFALDAITSFSTKPLRIAAWMGVVASLVALLLFAYTLWQWWQSRVISGWSSLMTAIAIFAAVQLLVLGIVGEYVGRLVQEVKGRPLFLIGAVRIGTTDYAPPVDFSGLPLASRRAVQDGWLRPKVERIRH